MSWSTAKFVKEMKAACNKLADTVERKNADYAGTEDPFFNFRLIETFTRGRISAEDGLLVRITDKLARLINLTDADAQVADESFSDTCGDMAGYAHILGLLRRSDTEPDETTAQAQLDTAAAQASAMERLKQFLANMGTQRGEPAI